jgi:hypothetical protein
LKNFTKTKHYFRAGFIKSWLIEAKKINGGWGLPDLLPVSRFGVTSALGGRTLWVKT